MTSYYRYHVFVCANARHSAERKSCNDCGEADSALDFLRKTVFEAGLSGKNGTVRINTAGCLGRCDEGPTLVVYPEGVWYRYQSEDDLRAIVNEHLQQGQIVERLLMPSR
ncbi:MAG: (2Fe-2S) ferredoxin domain-containing protein [Neisseria sp.]|nr:(2Fe-2S) ferredoxin domain-containing protein [Neisseria sp.]